MSGDQRIILIERQVLAALFQGFADGPLDDSLKQSLASYHWREPDHQALFAALMRCPSSDASVIAAEIPARLTRLGFPDVDWDFLKPPHHLSRSEALNLMTELLEEDKTV